MAITDEIISIKKLKCYIKHNKLHCLGRTTKTQQNYDELKKIMNRNWETKKDYIFHEIFNFPFIISPLNDKQLAPIPTMIQLPITKIMINNMPYNFESQMHHYCLWKIGGKITQMDINQAIETLAKTHKIQDYAYWENPPGIKSIEDVEHIHIVIQTII